MAEILQFVPENGPLEPGSSNTRLATQHLQRPNSGSSGRVDSNVVHNINEPTEPAATSS